MPGRRRWRRCQRGRPQAAETGSAGGQDGGLGASLEREIRHLVGAGSSDLLIKTLQESLSNWSTQLCQRLIADLSEMAAEGAASG
jgi:hypothetical protein